MFSIGNSYLNPIYNPKDELTPRLLPMPEPGLPFGNSSPEFSIGNSYLNPGLPTFSGSEGGDVSSPSDPLWAQILSALKEASSILDPYIFTEQERAEAEIRRLQAQSQAQAASIQVQPTVPTWVWVLLLGAGILVVVLLLKE